MRFPSDREVEFRATHLDESLVDPTARPEPDRVWAAASACVTVTSACDNAAVFVAVATPRQAVRDRVTQWADGAWPSRTSVRAHGWEIWTDGRELQQAVVLDDCVVVIDGVMWRGRELWSDDLARSLADDITEKWPLPEEWDGSFGVTVLRPDSVTVAVDLSGLRRAFFAHMPSGNTLAVSSLQVPCAIAASLEPDLTGVAEMLSIGHTLGQRSLFRGCTSVWPGQAVRIDRAGRITDLGTELAVDPTAPDDSLLTWHDAAEVLEPVLRQSAARAFDSFSSTAIALSSGTDSRLVLGALLPERVPAAAYSYGDPLEGDVRIPRRIASLAGCSHHTVDLRGRLLPNEEVTRRDALRCEATWHPAWMSVNEVLAATNSTALLLGDVTDSLQVRGEALWDRRQRVRRQLKQMLRPSAPEALPDHFASPESWWGHWIDDVSARVLKGRRKFNLDVDPSELTQGIHDDAAAAWACGHLHRYSTALQLEDAMQIPIARQQAGSQVNAVGGGLVGHAAFATRSCVTAGRNVGLALRKDRRLLLELSRRMVPSEISRLPTATIPLLPTTAPLLLQNGVWLTRFGTDWAIRQSNRLLRGRLHRERVAKSLELPAEYRAVGSDFFLANDWSRSGVFSPHALNTEFRSMQSGSAVPMIPISQYSAVRLDTMLAYPSG